VYTIPWFEEHTQAKRELHVYLSITEKLKPTTTHPAAQFWLAAMTRFSNC